MGWKITLTLVVMLCVSSFYAVMYYLDYQKLSQQYQKLQSDYQQLSKSYSKLKSDYNSLQSRYNSLRSSYESLKRSYDRVKRENQTLKALLGRMYSVPPGYYRTDAYPNHRNTLSELKRFLSQELRPPKGYSKGVFDCSESSAYLEWALEDAGFNAYIAVGWWSGYTRHAWVIVYTSDGHKVAIEATSGRIIYEGDSNWWKYYHGYDHLFPNIYSAVRYGGVYEWDWWRYIDRYVELC